jgi:hypothetical protein
MSESLEQPHAYPSLPNETVATWLPKVGPTCCASCNAYEDRLEEVRMAVTLDRPEKNPYERMTVEYAVWELREENKRLREALEALMAHQLRISSPDTRWELPVYQQARAALNQQEAK